MIDGVTGGVHRHELASGQLDPVGVFEVMRGVRCGEPAPAPAVAHRPVAELGPDGHLVALTAPWRGAARSGVAPAVHRVGNEFVVLAVGRHRLEGFLVFIGGVPPEPEAAMGHEVGAVLAMESPGGAEMIRVAVGDDDGMDALGRKLCLSQARHQCLPVGGAGQSRIDECRAAVVIEDVAVDVAETRHRHRQLQAPHVRSELGDLAVGRHLLLASRA